MNQQKQNKIRNYIIRRVDYPTLNSIIDQNFRYVKNEFDSDYTFHDFNYGLAAIIAEDLSILGHIDFNEEPIYNDLVDYFYNTLEDRSRKLYKHLTEFD